MFIAAATRGRQIKLLAAEREIRKQSKAVVFFLFFPMPLIRGNIRGGGEHCRFSKKGSSRDCSESLPHDATFFIWCFAASFVPRTSICFMPRIKRETVSLTELCSPSIILEKCVRANRTSATLVRDLHNRACRSVLPDALVKINHGKSRWERSWLDASSGNFLRCDKHLI